MHWEYDAEHGGLLYVRLAEGQVDGTIRLDEETLVDVAPDGRVLGIEVLNGEQRLPHLRHYPHGTIEAGPEPLLALSVPQNDEAARKRLAAFVEHVLGVLRALTAPVAKVS